MAIPKTLNPAIPFLIILSTLLLSREARTDTNNVFFPCGDTKVQKKDGFALGIVFGSRSAFFSSNNNSVQLSPCDSRLSISNGNSQVTVFHPKVDEISFLTINTSSFFPTRESDEDDVHDRDYDVAALANNLSQAFRYNATQLLDRKSNRENIQSWK
ncbi:uncharacterized protein LOC111395796 isoform X1 [Olea europaea var. sylvestris]|uniref:uncharacterized protein LOC111395796 isoform X1 n=1 Tax=Olea europaea var. sylvestris TaxID=158386 RepID=UPI000C1D2337|nr:uncharacterized protein LOC111395796 isoform X1 [Olea europaea var. sylvestris]XP_022877711.1 uncharacterized protein LOC111395796 isoform X1 [Olea europaea var. sylvestris]